MNSLYFYTGWTLVDITATGVTRDRPGEEFVRNQQRNWETVVQCIGLRAQPMEIQGPRMFETDDLSWLEFGEFYNQVPNPRAWVFSFAVDREEVFKHGNNPIGLLEDAFDQVPVITGLSETARFILPIFYTAGAIKNVYFKTGHLDLNSM